MGRDRYFSLESLLHATLAQQQSPKNLTNLAASAAEVARVRQLSQVSLPNDSREHSTMLVQGMAYWVKLQAPMKAPSSRLPLHAGSLSGVDRPNLA
jgi:hypothetical protein